MNFARSVLILVTATAALSFAQTTQPVYFAPAPGAAHAQVTSTGFSLSNAVIEQSWRIAGRRVQPGQFDDRINHSNIAGPSSPFTLLLDDGRVIDATALTVKNVSGTDIPAQTNSSRLAERFAGKAVRVELDDDVDGLHVTWTNQLRDGSNYIRQEIEIAATNKDVPIFEIRPLDWTLPDPHVVGTVKGSPIVSGTIFAGFEQPLSRCSVALRRAICRLDRELPVKAGHAVVYSTVIGVTSAGQLRRGFLYYVERERAHPYRTFLHYNSWYDLGYFNKYDDAGALDRVRAFGTELAQKRGVKLSSFLFDDGWDNSSTLWQFNAGFPNGLTNVRSAAEQFGADPGIWMSPWGGYGKPKQERVAAGKASGYEIVDNGFALSGPKYYELFRDTCLKMIREYGVNQFKFDGTGNANRVFPGSRFDSDFDAAIHLIGELRREKPDIYINLTTGTYPSPFWLRYADSIWRGGDDHSFLGAGSRREQWITYRDANTYQHVVTEGPLYPLNSLMLHGLIYARYAKDLQSDPGHDFKNEMSDYFGNGTQLQEMYITPSLLSKDDWDNLAEAAKWSAANADVLVDTHWIGGDPARLEVYGWASWSRRKGILVLRNPSDRPQTIAVDVANAFELPKGAPILYSAHSPWKEDAAAAAVSLQAGRPHTFELRPFEVVVLDATPRDR